MCGFVGAFGSNVTAYHLARAAATIAHRGRHGSQTHERGALRLVAHRLAIVPPDDAPPIHVTDRDVTVLNGEIYELPTSSDGPPLTDTARLAAWLAMQDGRLGLSGLRGLFAFCHFDGTRLLLARDRFGIKPLYYTFHVGGLVFASEMKALLALPGFSRDPDSDVLAAIDVVGHNVFVDRTPFRHIRSLRPGHLLSATEGSTPEERCFASVPSTPLPGEGLRLDQSEVADRVGALLDAAVRRSMCQDPKEKAVFLSGGLDSSLLLASAKDYGRVSAHVLTDREDADDLLESRKVASALGVPLSEHWLTSEELSREIVHYAWHFEQPIVGGVFDVLGGVAFHALAREIAKKTSVALCGEGADELFLGYHRLHVSPSITASALLCRAEGRATPALQAWLAELRLSENDPNTARALRDLAVHEGLSEYHLASVDRSGMAFGLEVRPPYLDEDLVDFVIGLDESVFLDREGGWTKRPLRAIARRRLEPLGLDRVAVRRKRAMPTALERAGTVLASELIMDTGHRDVANLAPLLRRLFWHLHVDPGFTSPPDYSLHHFAEAFCKQERRTAVV